MRTVIRGTLGAVLLWVVFGGTACWAFTEAVVFGDSLSDRRNFYDQSLLVGPGLPVSPPYADGRFTNGLTWVEVMANALGKPAPQPLSLGGKNYAVGGAETGEGFSSVGALNMISQAGLYLSANTPTGDELFIVWGGANELFDGGDPATAVANLGAIITLTASAGADEFLVPNLPLLGLTPKGAAIDAAGLNATAATFNTLLALALEDLRGSLGVTIHELDVAQLVGDVVASPASLGFTNATDPFVQLVTGVRLAPAGDSADTYVFWDDQHPTARGHEFIGLAAAQAVPEPATLAALTLGFGLLTLRRRARSAG